MSEPDLERPFYEIEFPLSGLDADAVEAALFECGACAVTLSDGGDDPVLEPKPGEVRLWRDTRVRALFEPADDAARAAVDAIARLSARLGSRITEHARLRTVQQRDWTRIWLADAKPLRFGRRLWVCPTSADAPADPAAVVVRLDPGLAFGTGTHPTTALCLQVLESLPLEGRTLIDYGCGSGILGIAALKLGASRVVAVDLDPQALIATRDNAERNGVSAALDIRAVPALLEPSECVVANILAGPLIELAPVLTAACAPGADLLLSGLLKSQAFEVKAAYAGGFGEMSVIGREEWCCLRGRKAG